MNYKKRYNHNDSRESLENRDRRHNQNYEKNLQEVQKKYSKGMILLKSSVFAMFIVLVVLFAAYEIIKHRKNEEALSSGGSSNCKKIQKIKISQSVESVSVSSDVLTIISKANSSGEQEIVRLDASCGNELNRILIVK